MREGEDCGAKEAVVDVERGSMRWRWRWGLGSVGVSGPGAAALPAVPLAVTLLLLQQPVL